MQERLHEDKSSAAEATLRSRFLFIRLHYSSVSYIYLLKAENMLYTWYSQDASQL